jgi:hypothetical protein
MGRQPAFFIGGEKAPIPCYTPGSVTLTVVESDALATGSFMALTATPADGGGSSVHGVWEQTSKNVIALGGVTLMRFVGPRFLSTYYKKVYDGLPTQT